MKKYLSSVAVILLAAVMCVTMFGCGKKVAVDKNNNVVDAKFSEYLVTEKVGNISRDNFSTAEGGLYYKDENGLYGVISYEGLHDTGAVYATCNAEGKYFTVSSRIPSDVADIAALNSVALIDSKGKTIIPAMYASYDILNERYVKATAVTRMTTVKDNALVYYTESSFSVAPSDDDILFEGQWCVYDITTGLRVIGVEGTNNNYVIAKGNYITFTDDSDVKKTVNQNGNPLPEGAYIFEDGSYRMEGKVGDVYDTNDQKIFSYDLTGFIPSQVAGDYYTARKSVDGKSKYAVMDKKGMIISAEFDESISVEGELVLSNEKIYNLDGDNVLKGNYSSLYYDKIFGQNWLAREEDYYTMIDKDGNVFFNGGFDDDYTVYTDDFVASKKTDDGYFYYSHKDQDYTIKGYSFAPWLVKTNNANSLYNLVDTMTGETILEGYKEFSHISKTAFAYYVYAKYNGGADVYLIVSSAQLTDVTQKKSDLLDDLIAAFEAEGITVTINKESGEMAMDSSVLFGGDSSELTADGKAFLNKFIKAYTNVAFSDKYAGFISKTMVEGHTAPVSGSTYASGLQLSEERAANVKAYCLSAETGVDVSNIANTLEAIGYSNSQPVYGSNGKVDMDASRRVSFRFMVNVEF